MRRAQHGRGMPLGASFKIDEKTRVVYLNKIVQRPCMRPRNHCHTNAAHCVASRDPPFERAPIVRSAPVPTRRVGALAPRRAGAPGECETQAAKGARVLACVFVSPKTATMQSIAIASLMSQRSSLLADSYMIAEAQAIAYTLRANGELRGGRVP
jgi:hypothetical protein